MIPIETQIFRLIFPPSGSIPLEKLEAVPQMGLIKQVGRDRIGCRTWVGIWELTDKARRILG
jgi:hypothetical protein